MRAPIMMLSQCVGSLSGKQCGMKSCASRTSDMRLSDTERFERAIEQVLMHEGGYVDDPRDPGGETNYGITRTTARAHGYRGSMRAIPMSLVRSIYRRSYWASVRGDDLPSGVDLAVFDFAVNSGPQRAAEFLQRVVGVPDDGKIGPITLGAVGSHDAGFVVSALCQDRMEWLQVLKIWPRFGRGWTRRVESVERVALQWIASEAEP